MVLWAGVGHCSIACVACVGMAAAGVMLLLVPTGLVVPGAARGPEISGSIISIMSVFEVYNQRK